MLLLFIVHSSVLAILLCVLYVIRYCCSVALLQQKNINRRQSTAIAPPPPKKKLQPDAHMYSMCHKPIDYFPKHSMTRNVDVQLSQVLSSQGGILEAIAPHHPSSLLLKSQSTTGLCRALCF